MLNQYICISLYGCIKVNTIAILKAQSVLLLDASRTEDNRCLGLVMWKQVVGEHWRRLFRGDSDGARCMLPPYQLTGSIGELHAWLCFQI